MSSYLPYNNSINKNLLDWKKYDFGEPRINQRNLFSMQVNLSDATLMGTEHSFKNVGYVTSRFQIRLNNVSILVDSYKQCQNP